MEWPKCPECGGSLNYEPNTVQWPPGAPVIHDADAKESAMLMVVMGYTEDGKCRTRYINRYNGSMRLTPKEWHNPLCAVHDPKRFNIPLPQRS
ncbi:MAG TPA: hypothetical protein VGK74_02400 [Symbiobacteriaceae bacterium]|jgi:hypothetical protein